MSPVTASHVTVPRCASPSPPLAAAPAIAHAQTRMLRSPTVSRTQIAFAYANNIWTVDRAGGAARRLTSFQGTAENPKFSPDGKLDRLQRAVRRQRRRLRRPRRRRRAEAAHLASRRRRRPGVDARRQDHRLQLVARLGGAERRAALLDRRGRRRARDADAAAARVPGEDLARRPAARLSHEQLWDEERRNYRGGQNRPIWIVDLKTYDLETTPKATTDLVVAQAGGPTGASNVRCRQPTPRTWTPCGSGNDAVYFISDRDGVANVWDYDTSAKKLDQVTHFTRLRRQDARRDGGRHAVVFEQAGVHPPARSEDREASTS